MIRNKSFTDNHPILYMIATPIGNLKEMTPYALEVLTSIDMVFCEDTRNTKSLLSKYDIHKECYSLREHNEASMSEKVISLLGEGKRIAYVSDAGYPAISDPGKILVKKVREAGYSVTTISGSNAMLSALVSSSRDTNHFYFHGFLPAIESKAKEELLSLKDRKETLIFYEAPHRIDKTLKLMFEVFGNREATIARELTKLNEEYIEGSLEELSSIDKSTLIGEMVIIVEGNKEENIIDEKIILDRAEYLLKKNIRTKDVADILAYEFNINKNYAYDLIIKNQK